MAHRWMWDCEDVRKDLRILKQKYKDLGYNLTLEQCYDVWTLHSENAHANWLNISNVEQSEWCVEEILEKEN